MDIRENVQLASYTTLQVGGPAKFFCEVTNIEDLKQARQYALDQAVPVLVLSGGSNLLVSDEGFPGLVVHNKITGREYQHTNSGHCLAMFGAGEPLDTVVAETVSHGYWGLENLSHIPGTVGATPVQNVGAYGVEVSHIIATVHAYNLDTGKEKKFSNIQCEFGYRDSFFKRPVGRSWCITAVVFQLSIEPNPKLDYKDLASLAEEFVPTQAAIREKVIEIRSTKFPDWHTVGTAGSFFKNPIITSQHAAELKDTYPELPMFPVEGDGVKVSLGYILDKICGLKGFKQGEVRLYEQQALVLINEGSSSAAIESFAAHIVEEVKKKTGIIIDQEVTTV